MLRGCTSEPWGAAKAAAQCGGAAKQTKDESRSGLTAALRPPPHKNMRRLQASAVVSDAEKASLGITVAQQPGPMWGGGPPVTASICDISCGARLQHTLSFVDSK